MKAYRETFNDGFLSYGRKQTIRSNGKRAGETFKEEGKLAFKVMSCRDSDYQLIGIMGSSLDYKVKTLFPPSFKTINKNKLKVKISNTEFDVIKVDSEGNKYLYFYLQEVGSINE